MRLRMFTFVPSAFRDTIFGRSRMVAAQQLKTGDDTLTGTLGEGTDKRRLLVTAEQEIQVMSLLRSPTGHLSDLSSSAVPHDHTLLSDNQ